MTSQDKTLRASEIFSYYTTRNAKLQQFFHAGAREGEGGNGVLDPLSTATRAEVTAMILNFISK